MNFVADESVDYPIVLRLRQEKYTVWAVAEMEPGIADTTAWILRISKVSF